jgi:hypothetical protein
MAAGTSAPSRLPAVLDFDKDELPSGQETENRPDDYKYETFPDSHFFRVFELLPGVGTSKLCSQISIENFDEKEIPYYRALSYTWMESKYDNLIIAGEKVIEFSGPREIYSIQHPIWISGCRLPISTNLRDALRRFRDSDQSVRLWIDAIGINQQDLDERAYQVLLMPRIYHSAMSVWFWLGEVDDASRITLRWMTALHEAISQSMSEAPQSPPNVILEIDPSEAKSLVSFLQRPVFRRIWIIQELATAREIIAYCGESSVPFRIIQIALDTFGQQSLDDILSNQYSPGQNCFHCVNVILRVQREWYLNRRNVRQSLVLLTRNFMATDPKDKIFALMGLFNDFAHRDSCHLGLCDKSHSTPGHREAVRGVKIVRDRESEFAWCANAINSAIHELLAHEAKVLGMELDRNAAKVFCQCSDVQVQAVRHCLTKYLLSFIGEFADRTQLSNSVKLDERSSTHEKAGQEADEEAGGEAGEEQDETADGFGTTRIVRTLNDFLGLDLEDPDLQLVQNFVSDILIRTQADYDRVSELMGHKAMLEPYSTASSLATRRLHYLLDLITPDITAGNSANRCKAHDPQMAEDRTFCEFHIPHTNPSTYDPGEICAAFSNGTLLVGCYSWDKELFGTALKALRKSELPPHAQCTLSEASWRLLKAIFGDMSKWNQSKLSNGIIEVELDREGRSLEEAPNLEELVDAKWLTIPLYWYLEVRIFVPNFKITVQSDEINQGKLTRKTGIQEEIRAA